MFESTGVLNKVEIEARTEVKWETYTKKIQIEGRVLGDLTMNHIVPIASRYEAMLLDKVYKMAQIGGLDASADIDLLKKIQGHTAAIQTLTIEMIEARKKANRIENARAKAIALPRHGGGLLRGDPPPHRQARRDHRRPDVDAAQISGTSVHQIGSVIFSQVVRTPRKHFRGVFFCNRRPRNSRDTTNRCRCRPPIPYAVHFGTTPAPLREVDLSFSRTLRIRQNVRRATEAEEDRCSMPVRRDRRGVFGQTDPIIRDFFLHLFEYFRPVRAEPPENRAPHRKRNPVNSRPKR